MAMTLADKYDVQARYTPAILCSVPFIALGFYFLGSIDARLWVKVFAISFGGPTMSAALYQLAAFSCRLVGKYLEERIFDYGLDFPTTRFLLRDDLTYSDEHKDSIVRKILEETKIDLKRRQIDTPANRRRINEAIAQVRRRFFQKNELLLQRNIYFGFSKNTAGGSLIAILTSVVLAGLSLSTGLTAALHLSVILLIGYLILAILSLLAMKFTARHYALTLFDEFLGV